MIVIRFDISSQGAIAVNQFDSAVSKLQGKIVIPEAAFARIFRVAQWLNSFHFGLLKKFKSYFFLAILGNIIGYYNKKFRLETNSHDIILLDDGLVTVDVANKLSITGSYPRLRVFTRYKKFLVNPSFLAPCDFQTDAFVPKSENLSRDVLGVFGSPLVETNAMSYKDYEGLIFGVMERLGYSSLIYFMHRREIPKFRTSSIHEVQSGKLNSLEMLADSSVVPAEFWSCGSSALIHLFLSDTNQTFRFFYTSLDLEVTQTRELLRRGIAHSTIYEHYEIAGFTEVSIPKIMEP